MKPATTLANRLRAGETVVTAWSGLPGIALAEELVLGGYEAVTLDMQHGRHDFGSVRDAIPVVLAAGGHPVARIPVGDFATASRLLDAGAEAVIAPMINCVEDARAFASFMKFPPTGGRSWGPMRAMSLHGVGEAGAYLMSADSETLSFGMIETREAIDDLDAILAVDGLDGVFVGPSDLSIALSDGVRLDPGGEDTQSAAAGIAAAARRAGKLAGIYCNSPGDVRAARQMGYSFLAWTGDSGIIRAGVAAILGAIAQ